MIKVIHCHNSFSTYSNFMKISIAITSSPPNSMLTRRPLFKKIEDFFFSLIPIRVGKITASKLKEIAAKPRANTNPSG